VRRDSAQPRWYARCGKRWLDVAASILLFVITAPVLLAIAVLVRLTLGSPVLFRQMRPGLHGRPFVLYKFRTMRDCRSTDGQLLPDEARLTTVGWWLRSTSLDESPELINVIRGDMSLVGPRPLLTQYLDRYSDEQKRRHNVRPGITGWAQVRGRNALGWPERFACDLWYVDHLSFLVDLKILTLTVLKVIQREGITPRGRETVEEFEGNRNH
jgi:sugar transferase EpsL